MKKKAKYIRKVYLEVWKGNNAFFISERYQLQAHVKDTERDTFFLNRDIVDFRSRADIFQIEGREYVVLFMCDVEDKETFMMKYLSLKEIGKIRAVELEG